MAVVMLVMLTGCGGGTTSQKSAAPSESEQPWYREQTQQLAKLVSEANEAFAAKKQDDAAALIKEAEPIATKLLAVRQPSLTALEAASDLDDLYGRMLLANKNFGWARMMFQKNQARWRHYEPVTPDVTARRKQAEERIAACDRGLAP